MMKKTTQEWRAVRRLFREALQQPATQQRDFISSADASDGVKHEALTLLDAAADTGKTFEQVVAQVVEDASHAQYLEQTIDHYRIKRLLGEGGMGEVYLAERADEQYQQQVALKILSGRRPTDELIERFRAERQMLATLDHPHIARLLDGGETNDGTPYLVMEHVDGVAIDDYCDTHSLGLRERIALFTEVCAAIDHAHRKLIVHRDVKPSNILVTGEGSVKLLDFGIAKLLDADPDTSLTRSSARILSPLHASPEQVRGEQITVATDVYALGVLLYELLSGFHPYAENVGSAVEIERAICETDPGRPSARLTIATAASHNELIEKTRRMAAADLAKALRGDLDNIVLTALAKEPERRYGSVREFAEDLERYLGNRPVQARPSTATYRVRKYVQRHRAAAGVAAVALAIIAIGSAAFVRQILSERDAARDAQHSAEAVSDFLSNIFLSVTPGNAKGEEVTAMELLANGQQQVGEDLAEAPATQLVMHRLLGEAYYSLGQYDPAEQQLQQALEIADRLPSPDPTELATVKLLLGFIAQDLSDWDRAEALFATARALREDYHQGPHFDVAEVIAAEAHLLDFRGMHDEAIASYQMAIDVLEQLGPEDQSLVGEAMTDMAGVLRKEQRNEEARDLLDRALIMLVDRHGPLHPDVADAKRHLAGIFRDTGEFEKSEALYLEVIAARKKMFGPDHLEVGHVYNSFSQMLNSKGDLEAAVEAAREFMRVLDVNFDGPNASYGAAYNNYAYLQHDAGQYDAAIQSFRKSIEQQDLIGLAPDHFHRSFPLYGMGNTYAALNKLQQAESLFRQALPMREQNFDTSHLFVNQVRNALGQVLLKQGHLDEAEALITVALQHLKENQGETHQETKNAVRNLALVQQARAGS